MEAFELGIDDCLAEPFRPTMLVKRVQSAARLVDMHHKVARELEVQREQTRLLCERIRKIRDSAVTDELTGLRNRRYLEQYLADRVSACSREERHLSVGMIDVDGLRALNERCGHIRASDALRLIAQGVARCMPVGGFVARYGGDEFVAVMPDLTLRAAVEVAERMRGAVAEAHFTCEGDAIRLTISVGVSSLGAYARTLDALLSTADRAAYEAKRLGRNRVVAFRP